jgi:hypothetical protein
MAPGIRWKILRLFVLAAIGLFLLAHPPIQAKAAAYCGDCPQGVQVGGPDCPWGSACQGCWSTCNWDSGPCELYQDNCHTCTTCNWTYNGCTDNYGNPYDCYVCWQAGC